MRSFLCGDHNLGMKRSLLLPRMPLVLLSAALSACGPVTMPTPVPPDSGSGVLPYQSAEERNIMEPLLASLRPEDRETVVYVRADGQMFSNKKEWRLPQVLAPQNASVGGQADGVQVHSMSDLPLSFPTFEARPGSGLQSQGIAVNLRCNTSDGPFHRVNTVDGTPATPYSYIGANIVLPSPSQINLKTYAGNVKNEAAFAYFGGWGSGVNSAVDAGFVYSPVTRTWTQFMMVQGNKTYVTVSYARTNQVRLFSGTLPTQFYVPVNGKIALATTATFTNGHSERHTLVTDAPAWQASGIGNIVKFATSITQPQGVNFMNGSSFRDVQFNNLKTGTPAAPRDWQLMDSMVYSLDASGLPLNRPACDYPNDETRLSMTGGTDHQRITIDLHP